MTNLDSILKSRDITLLTKSHIVEAMFFQQSSMDERFGPQRRLSTKEMMFLHTVVLEKTLDHHLDRRKIKPVNPKGNQS